jgi:hypothetical protein
VESQSRTEGSGKPAKPVRPETPIRPVKPGRLKNEPTLALAPEPWDRNRARRLDPLKALRLRGQTPPRPTLYVGDTLLLRGLVGDNHTLQDLHRVAAKLTLRIVDDAQVGQDAELLARAELPDTLKDELRAIWVSVVQFEPDTDEPALPPDAWAVLQNLRAHRTPAQGQLAGIALEHVVASQGPDVGGNPFTESHSVGGNPFTESHSVGGNPFTESHSVGGNPFTESHSVGGNPFTESHGAGGNPFTESHGAGALSGYGVAGLGGRQPVNWVGQAPANRYPLDGSTVRRPVVALLDSGVAAHPWLGPDQVERDPTVLGQPLGMSADPADTTGTSDALIGDLDADAGHGTFIAGLIRQCCPDAMILAVKVFGGDGVVAEGQLLRSLQLLALRQALAVHGDASTAPVDVVSLSLGYYHEQPEDADFDALLLGPIALLGRLGATVVVSAGNDATVRPMYPAAFTPYEHGLVPASHDALPVIAVGALNPNESVALFSNDGPWVRALRPGAALVSSYPRTFDASGQPTAELVTADGEWRSSLDPDDFSAGFAIWSGTSFAAPVLAGQIAAQLLALYAMGSGAVDAAAAVDRGWTAIAAATADDPDPVARP